MHFSRKWINLIFFTLEEAEPEIFSLHGWDDRNEWDGGCCFAKTFPSNIQTLLLLPAGNPDSIFLPRGDTLLPCEISPSFLPLALGCGHANLPQLARFPACFQNLPNVNFRSAEDDRLTDDIRTNRPKTLHRRRRKRLSQCPELNRPIFTVLQRSSNLNFGTPARTNSRRVKLWA